MAIPVDPSDSMAILVDRISDLPESIISDILSQLTTKEAVATSILSRSWRFRWTGVTSFRFTFTGDKDAAVADFVDRVLLNRSRGDSINEFELHNWPPSLGWIRVFKWVGIAIARKVRILEVSKFWSSKCMLHLPPSLYTSKTLEVLKLRGRFLFKPSNVVCLPRLTELELAHVIYVSDESLPRFISGCPVLESLKIKRLRIGTDNLVVCSISSPVLKHVSIYFKCHWEGKRAIGRDLKLKIDAPALESLYIRDALSSHISIQPRLSSVKEVRFEAPNVAHSAILELYQAFDSVEILTLHSTVIGRDDFSVAFKKVVKLDIHSQRRPRWSCLMDLLGGCVNLKELLFCCYEPEPLGDPWRDPARVPSCLVSSLTSLTLRGFGGLEDEMAMLRFFLDHSLGLERLKICSDDDQTIEVLHQVSQLSRASPSCKIYWLEEVCSSSAQSCECFNS